MLKEKMLLVPVMGALISYPASIIGQKESTQTKPDKRMLATENVKELVLLMDTDKNGKISKREWMDFMAAEFDRLDKDKSGQLDAKELEQSRLSIRPLRYSDQGK